MEKAKVFINKLKEKQKTALNNLSQKIKQAGNNSAEKNRLQKQLAIAEKAVENRNVMNAQYQGQITNLKKEAEAKLIEEKKQADEVRAELEAAKRAGTTTNAEKKQLEQKLENALKKFEEAKNAVATTPKSKNNAVSTTNVNIQISSNNANKKRKNNAATKIQARFRGMQNRKKYKNLKQAAAKPVSVPFTTKNKPNNGNGKSNSSSNNANNKRNNPTKTTSFASILKKPAETVFAPNASGKPAYPTEKAAGPAATFASMVRKPSGKPNAANKQTRVRSNGAVATIIPVTDTSSGVTSKANDSPNLKSNATSGKWQMATGKGASKPRNATSNEQRKSKLSRNAAKNAAAKKSGVNKPAVPFAAAASKAAVAANSPNTSTNNRALALAVQKGLKLSAANKVKNARAKEAAKQAAARQARVNARAKKEREAANKVAANAAAAKAKTNTPAEKAKTNAAAEKAKTNAAEKAKKEEEAATKIQAAARGMKNRKVVETKKQNLQTMKNALNKRARNLFGFGPFGIGKWKGKIKKAGNETELKELKALLEEKRKYHNKIAKMDPKKFPLLRHRAHLSEVWNLNQSVANKKQNVIANLKKRGEQVTTERAKKKAEAEAEAKKKVQKNLAEKKEKNERRSQSPAKKKKNPLNINMTNPGATGEPTNRKKRANRRAAEAAAANAAAAKQAAAAKPAAAKPVAAKPAPVVQRGRTRAATAAAQQQRGRSREKKPAGEQGASRSTASSRSKSQPPPGKKAAQNGRGGVRRKDPSRSASANKKAAAAKKQQEKLAKEKKLARMARQLNNPPPGPKATGKRGGRR